MYVSACTGLMMNIASYFQTRTIDRREDSSTFDHRDEVAIAALYLLVMMIMAVLIRLAFRFFMLRSLQRDDGIISLALVFGIAQSGVIFQGTKYGMGKRQSALSTQQVIDVEKTLYASDLLYVLALSLTKISVLEFLNKLCVNKSHKIVCFWTSIVVLVWTFPVFFTLAFKCGAPRPWEMDNGKCIDTFRFWAAISSVDIVTEIIICLLPIYIIKPVQVSFGKKVPVVVAFAYRLTVIIATIMRLVFMHNAPNSTDMTQSAFETRITTQCVLCVTLITACIPCLKPFLDAFDSGMLGVGLRKRTGGSRSDSYNNSYALASMSRGAREATTRFLYLEDEAKGLGTSAAAFAFTSPVKPQQLQDIGPSMGIQRTDQWSVRCEYVDTKPRSLGEGLEESETSGSGVEHSL